MPIILPWLAVCVAILAMATAGSPALAQPVEEKAAVCSACHGEDGVPADKSIPVIWGQNEGYIYLQLRDYKLGNRKNETMAQIAGGLEKPDMQQLAAYFAAKQWPDLGQSRSASRPCSRGAPKRSTWFGRLPRRAIRRTGSATAASPRASPGRRCSICARR